MSTPLERYREDLQRPDFIHDAAQELAVRELQDLYQRLLQQRKDSRSWSRRIASTLGREQPLETGLYFWGGVGRGKTYLMDTFFECLPFDEKLRIHFHRFMQRVHRELAELEGEKNPLDVFMSQLADETQIICFDEFFVSDIADAMILANCLRAMFEKGIALVATSNIEPSGLYKDGLQRARFLPAIALLEQHTKILNVDAGTDYRLRTLEQATLFYSPLGPEAEASLHGSYLGLTGASSSSEVSVSLEVNGRELTCRRLSEGVVWFDFRALCDGPRSQNDYIEIAREFHTVLLSDIPRMHSAQDDMCRRFINLVDEFYDRHVKFIVSAAASVAELYDGDRLAFEFQRTVSRLLEMQSREYLTLEHRP